MFWRERPPDRVKLGVVANEFFDLAMGRMGGFGWAAAQVAGCFSKDPTLGVEVVFFTGDVPSQDAGVKDEVVVHGCRLLLRTTTPYAERVRREAPDILLLIDYRPSYQEIVAAVRAPVILWVRDPKTSQDVSKLGTLEIPGQPGVRPLGIRSVDTTSFRRLYRARWRFRRILVATTTPALKAKVPGAYGVTPKRIFDLPNVIETAVTPVVKNPTPRVVFLGRLDPVKRPWILVEVARRMPEVEFLVLGRAYLRGPGGWEPNDVPTNVRLIDHVEGEAKRDALASAWALLNTSIHEGLAVSLLEALAVETPLVSCQDPEGVASRFGTYVGRWDGSGLDGVPAFVDALDRLLRDSERRERLGRQGRLWVSRTHTRATFLQALAELGARAGVPLRFGGPPAP